ncbi:MAG: HlyD family type I secretion periplasmic adaptor subunit [Rhodospirillales bacterium]|nr:HlyD family type I secretion periplasmic adaptor subunit [Rhodospirillales bacterium]MSP81243.1 HlyD family type I secretion periplasmic adaptor subunit [Rhodospirillales bacterium]
MNATTLIAEVKSRVGALAAGLERARVRAEPAFARLAVLVSGEGDDAEQGARLFVRLGGALIVVAFVWATFAPLDVVATANGEVIPATQIKSVQHLEGGIVREILVREGQKVEKNQPLVVLETTASDADVQELRVRTNSLRTEIARLEAEGSGAAAPAFPADLASQEPALVAQALDTFRTRTARLESLVAQAREQIVQREQEIKEIGSRIETDRAGLGFSREQIKISEELLKDDLTNRMLHLNLLKEESALKGRIEENASARRRVEAALTEARARLDNVRRSAETEINEALGEKRRALDEFASRQRKFSDSLDRTVLRAPGDGVIKTMYVATVGGVVKAGGTVADMVPAGDVLVIEAKLPPQDVGHVRRGQTATIKLASADAVRFGNLEGKVTNVSPDSIMTQQGATFYKVRIETERDYFQQRNLRYDLVPGVQVATSILTGRRTVLEYLLDPLIGGADTALRER